jgi:hypothetical protein
MRPHHKRERHALSPRRAWLISSLFLAAPLLVLPWLRADDARPATADKQWEAKSDLYQLLASAKPLSDAEPLTAVQLAQQIDAILADTWKSAGVVPAPPTTDAEFVRRVYLDLIGRIPSVAETLNFVDDQRPDKRRQLVEDLLGRGAWAAHFANTWRDMLLAGSANPEMRAQVSSLESWLRLRFSVNMPYDRMARELLTAEVRSAPTSAVEPSASAFYQAADFKPELLAASTTRVFLGIQLQCAQCHDHPFASWKRQQFWQMAAFFKDAAAEAAAPAEAVGSAISSLKSLVGMDDADALTIPETKIVVKPQFLDGTSPTRKADETKRQILAKWVTTAQNPLFARAAVNRLWDHFFGRGLVSPVDHLDTAGPPSQPQLFDELSQQFVLHGYDMKYLIRAITATRAYQLSSQAAGPSDEKQLVTFARMPLRRMSGDQLYASFVQATGFQPTGTPAQQVQVESSARDEFQARFNDTSVPRTEAPTTILQALAVMNGRYVTEATDLVQSHVFAAVATAPYLDTRGRVELLFLTALSRRPDAGELEDLSAYVAAAGARGETQALADAFWSLLNSAEFVLNH